MGAICKRTAKIWFFCWDIPALIALINGRLLICAAIISIAGTTSAALWLYGDHLETKAAPSKIAAWRGAKGLDP